MVVRHHQRRLQRSRGRRWWRTVVPALHRQGRQHLLRRRQPCAVADDPRLPQRQLPTGRQPVHLVDGLHRPQDRRGPLVLPGPRSTTCSTSTSRRHRSSPPRASTAPTRRWPSAPARPATWSRSARTPARSSGRRPSASTRTTRPRTSPRTDRRVEVYPGQPSAASRRPWPTPTATVYAAYLDYPQYQTATGQDADASRGLRRRAPGGLVALDVTTGKVLWDIKLPTPAGGGRHGRQRRRVRGRHRRHLRGLRRGRPATRSGATTPTWASTLRRPSPATTSSSVPVFPSWPTPTRTRARHRPRIRPHPRHRARSRSCSRSASAVPWHSPAADQRQNPRPSRPTRRRLSRPARRRLSRQRPQQQNRRRRPRPSRRRSRPRLPRPRRQRPPATTVDLSAVDLAFQPKDFTIPANTDVTIDVSNDGAVVHDFFQPDTKLTRATSSRARRARRS